MDTQSLDLSALTDDGDTLDLTEGRSLRLRVLPDSDASVNDYDSDGRIEWAPCSEGRPDGFDGGARVIDVDWPSRLWWQPPTKEMTGAAWDAATLDSEAHRVADLCRYGFVGMLVELVETVTDSRGGAHEVIVDTAALWGVEWDVDRDYSASVVSELVAELGA